MSIKTSCLGLPNKILSVGLLVTVASLPFSPFGTSLGVGLMGLSFIVALATRTTVKPSNKILPGALVAGFIWATFSLLWSDDQQAGIDSLTIKLPLFAAALSLFYVQWNKSLLVATGKAFITSTFIAALVGILWGNFIDQGNFSPFISHIRMGLMLALGVGILLLRKKWVLSISYCVLGLLSVWHTQSITGLGMIAFAIFFAGITSAFKRYRTTTIVGCIAFSVLGLAGVFHLVRPTEFDGELLEDKTPWGGEYKHKTERHLEENGKKVWVYVAEDEMRSEWNLRSEKKYDSTDEKGHSVRTTLIRYLTSLGLKKNGEVVKAMSEEDIKNVESGFTSIRQVTHSGLNLRLDDLRFELGNYLDGGDPNGNSVTMRYEAFKTGAYIMKSKGSVSILTGVGEGDLYSEMKIAYAKTTSRLKEKFWKKPHNQYLSLLIEVGIVGLMIWVITLYGSWIVGGDMGRLAWWIIALSCLAEDTLETQAGVTFAALALTVFHKWKS